MHMQGTDSGEGIFYVLLRAVSRFYSEYNHYHGYFNHQLGSDIGNLKVNVQLPVVHLSLIYYREGNQRNR